MAKRNTLMHSHKKFLFKFDDSGTVIALARQQPNKNTFKEKDIQYVQGTTKYKRKLSCCISNSGGDQVLHLAQR